MLIKMRTHYAGPDGVCASGNIIALPDAEANNLIKIGYAVSAEPPRPPGRPKILKKELAKKKYEKATSKKAEKATEV